MLKFGQSVLKRLFPNSFKKKKAEQTKESNEDYVVKRTGIPVKRSGSAAKVITRSPVRDREGNLTGDPVIPVGGYKIAGDTNSRRIGKPNLNEKQSAIVSVLANSFNDSLHNLFAKENSPDKTPPPNVNDDLDGLISIDMIGDEELDKYKFAAKIGKKS